jgi:hypothetical protein
LLEPKGKVAPDYQLDRLKSRFKKLSEDLAESAGYDTSYLRRKRIHKKVGDKIVNTNRLSLNLDELNLLFAEDSFAEGQSKTLKLPINRADWKWTPYFRWTAKSPECSHKKF